MKGRLVYLMIDKNRMKVFLDDENLYKTPKTFSSQCFFTELSLEYSVILPSAQFTGYGIGKIILCSNIFSWFQTVLIEIISLKNITKI